MAQIEFEAAPVNDPYKTRAELIEENDELRATVEAYRQKISGQRADIKALLEFLEYATETHEEGGWARAFDDEPYEVFEKARKLVDQFE